MSLPTQESARLPRVCLQRKGRKWWWQVRPLRCTVLLPASRGLRAHWARLCLRAGPRALSTDPLSKAGFTSPNLQTGADLQLDRARQLASELGEGQAFAQVCWSCCLGCWPAAVTRVLAAKLLGTKVVECSASRETAVHACLLVATSEHAMGPCSRSCSTLTHVANPDACGQPSPAALQPTDLHNAPCAAALRSRSTAMCATRTASPPQSRRQWTSLVRWTLW